MTRWLLWILSGLLLGGIVHIATVLYLPNTATQNAYARVSAITPINQVVPMPAPSHGRPLIEMSDVTKRFVTRWRLFGKPTEFTAVKDATFSLGENEFLGVVGESGSGKSTIARLAVGLEAPTEGRIVIDNMHAPQHQPLLRVQVAEEEIDQPKL